MAGRCWKHRTEVVCIIFEELAVWTESVEQRSKYADMVTCFQLLPIVSSVLRNQQTEFG